MSSSIYEENVSEGYFNLKQNPCLYPYPFLSPIDFDVPYKAFLMMYSHFCRLFLRLCSVLVPFKMCSGNHTMT